MRCEHAPEGTDEALVVEALLPEQQRLDPGLPIVVGNARELAYAPAKEQTGSTGAGCCGPTGVGQRSQPGLESRCFLRIEHAATLGHDTWDCSGLECLLNS